MPQLHRSFSVVITTPSGRNRPAHFDIHVSSQCDTYGHGKSKQYKQKLGKLTADAWTFDPDAFDQKNFRESENQTPF